MKTIFFISLATVFLAAYFSAASPRKDQSRITEQAYVLEHILKGKPERIERS